MNYKSDENKMNNVCEYSLWGGRFDKKPSHILKEMNNSLKIDIKLYKEEIRASEAYAEALYDVNILDAEEYEAIIRGLKQVQESIENDLVSSAILSNEEDIHSLVEAKLVNLIGEQALKLHTGRSRNEQVTTDTRLWLMSSFVEIKQTLLGLLKIISHRAKEELHFIMPGYTHLQRAQPVRWSQFLMRHGWTLQSDCRKLKELRSHISECPLGSGAIAGCAFGIDRIKIAKRLGFDKPTPNSMCAVSERDFAVEFLQWSTLCAIHMSRLAEDLILYNSQEFGFIQISDEYSTGSSLMPQKRNPDSLELIRSVAANTMGDCVSLCAMLSRLPSTYNKDMQLDKEIIFRTFKNILNAINVLADTVKTLRVKNERMLGALDSSMLCTDLAYTLVKEGIPFRIAHEYVGRAQKLAEENNTTIDKVDPILLDNICKNFPSDFFKTWTWEDSVEQYNVIGGTSKNSVLAQIDQFNNWLAEEMTLKNLNL